MTYTILGTDGRRGAATTAADRTTAVRRAQAMRRRGLQEVDVIQRFGERLPAARFCAQLQAQRRRARQPGAGGLTHEAADGHCACPCLADPALAWWDCEIG